MPCYITPVKPASRAEYEQWLREGYTGSFARYAAVKRKGEGSRVFVCGALGPHCADCLDLGENLCDYPVGEGKTCDRSMCESHGREVGPDLHYCLAHHAAWRRFVEGGGVGEHLRNVVAFKPEK